MTSLRRVGANPTPGPQFYDNLAKRTAHNGHIIDIFAGCLDQVGLLEMKGLCNSTGGHMILTDSFTSSMFRQSFVRVFEKDGDDNLLMGFNAVLEVLTTKELKVTGLIGHAVVAEQEIDVGGRDRVRHRQHVLVEDVRHRPKRQLRHLL